MEGLCRGCLNQFDEPTDLLQYCESNRRLFVYTTGLQVKRNDTFTFQLCKQCYLNMKLSCKFKKQCRDSDKKFKHFVSLKEDGDSIDFNSYLRNAKDLGLPIVSRSSTPIHQRNKDDDNESTCTSIQNFMSDMLEGEEMPPTEARIIREVIQEEADILDDSLDSYWLEEDNSVGSDFGIDFNFSTFSSPQNSINNDRCYTPKKVTDKKEELNYHIKEITGRSDETQIAHPNDMPVIDNFGIEEFDNAADSNMSIETALRIKTIIGTDKQQINIANQIDMPLLDDCNTKCHSVVGNNIVLGDIETEFCSKRIDKPMGHGGMVGETDGAAQNDPFAKLESFKDNIFSESNDISPFVNNVSLTDGDDEISNTFIAPTTNENDGNVILNKEIAEKLINDCPLTRDLDFYTNNVEMQKANNYQARKTNEGEVQSYLKNIHAIFNRGKVDKTVKQSPLTCELEHYINKAKIKKEIDSDFNAINSESNSSDHILNIWKGNTNSPYKGQQTEKDSVVKFRGNNLDDSPFKQELEQYIKKAKSKRTKKYQTLDQNKTSNKEINDELCSIDKNLERAIKNEVKEEFSLDQLLVSPEVTIQSGTSTPTINNILFGSLTPIENGQDSNIVPDLKEIEVKHELDSADFIEEFLKDDDCESQSTPKKKSIPGGKPAGFKDIKTRKKHKHKTKSKHTRGFKDINKLKELLKDDHEDQTSRSELETDQEPLDVEQVKIEEKEIDKNTGLPVGEIEDMMDISLTSLLNFDDNQSVDLNMSISSDFLKEEKPDDSVTEQVEVIADPFKRPFSPPDNKYDLDKRLCKICNTSFGSSRGLSIHFIKTHKLKIKKHTIKKRKMKVCQFCGKEYKDKSNLNKHLKKHEAPVIVNCKYCFLNFETQVGLTRHMKVHADEIGETNTDKENIKNKDKMKYVCSTCGLVTTNISNFKVHQRRHTKNYTVKCNVCQKGFYRMNELDQHMTHHTREFKFSCQFCPKLYKRRMSLVCHMKRHLDKIKYECSVCNVKFVSKHLLKNHYNTKLCMKNGDLAKEAQEDTEATVTVINAVGSNDKLKEIIDKEGIPKENEHKESVIDKDTSEEITRNEVEVQSERPDEEIKIEPLDTVEICPELFLEMTEEVHFKSEPVSPKPMEEG